MFKVVYVQRSKRSKKCVFGDQNDHAYVEVSNVIMLRDQKCQRCILLKITVIDQSTQDVKIEYFLLLLLLIGHDRIVCGQSSGAV